MFKVFWFVLLKPCLKMCVYFANLESEAAARGINEMQELEVDKFRLE